MFSVPKQTRIASGRGGGIQLTPRLRLSGRKARREPGVVSCVFGKQKNPARGGAEGAQKSRPLFLLFSPLFLERKTRTSHEETCGPDQSDGAEFSARSLRMVFSSTPITLALLRLLICGCAAPFAPRPATAARPLRLLPGRARRRGRAPAARPRLSGMSSASIRRRRPPRLSAVVQNDEMGWLAGGPAKMAATNKCLAQNNKPRRVSDARSGHWTVGTAPDRRPQQRVHCIDEPAHSKEGGQTYANDDQAT